MENELIEIDLSEFKVGLRVQDKDGNIGTVIKCEEIHDILVRCDNGGIFIYCLDKGCVETKTINGQLVEIPQYDPLYKV